MGDYERFSELLRYEPETGKLYWRVSRGRVKAGSEAGTPAERGYIKVSVDGKTYLAHRVAWLLYFGKWPEKGLDHRNTKTNDNRIDNLREATQVLNMLNRSNKNIGVYPTKTGMYEVRLRSKYYGRYSSLEVAKTMAARLREKESQNAT